MIRKQFNCPAEMTLHVMGGKWKIIVIWLLRKGPQRSGKLKSMLPGISPTAFSISVRELESAGLVKRICKQKLPPEVSYALTQKGLSLVPIVKSLVKWGLLHQKDYVVGEFRMAPFSRSSGRPESPSGKRDQWS